MKRVSVAGLAALVVLAGCATQKAEPIAGFWKQVPPISEPDAGYSAADAAKDWEAIHGRPMPTTAEQHEFKPVPGFVAATGDDKADQKRALALSAPAADGDAAAEAKREHQQAQLTAIAAECRYELDAHPGPGYRASRGFGLGGAIAGTFIEAAMNGAILKQRFAECVQARALAVDAGLN